jgi:hypothetical protein
MFIFVEVKDGRFVYVEQRACEFQWHSSTNRAQIYVDFRCADLLFSCTGVQISLLLANN